MTEFLQPSLPSHLTFLSGPIAAPHWKIARSVSPHLSNTASEDAEVTDHNKASSRSFSASRTAGNESNGTIRRRLSALKVFEEEIGVPEIGATEMKKEQGGRKPLRPIYSAFKPPAGHGKIDEETRQKASSAMGLRTTKESANFQRSSSALSDFKSSRQADAHIEIRNDADFCRKQMNEEAKHGIRKASRPVFSAHINSPARCEQKNKQAWDKHLKRLRPVTAIHKLDHLQEYYESLKKVAPLETDPKSLEALRDSVRNFQEKFRKSILSGLIGQYQRRLEKKQDMIGKMESAGESMVAELLEIEKKTIDLTEKMEQVDKEHENMLGQVRPLEDKVHSAQKMIDQRGSKGRSEALIKELKDNRLKMNTIKGKMKEVLASRNKTNLQLQKNVEMLAERQVAQRKLKERLTKKIEDEAKLSRVVAQAANWIVNGGDVCLSEDFPKDLAAAVQSCQHNQNVPEEEDHESSPDGRGKREGRKEGDMQQMSEKEGGQDGSTEEDRTLRKEEQDFRGDPSVWIRRRELAMRATSPRWRAALLEETERWEQLYKRSDKERKRHLEDDEPQPLASPKKRIKSPCTKTYREEHSRAAEDWNKSFYKAMKDHCAVDWQKDFSDRLLMKGHRDHRSNWSYQGLPCDSKADEVRLREIRKDRQFPSPEEDIAALRNALAGKWKNMEKIFEDIDADKSGYIDVHEFSKMCERLKLGWSEFQVHRIFRNVSGEDMQVDFVEFYNAFAPPRATTQIKMLFHNKVPFLILESEGAVEEVINALVKVIPPPKAKDFIYKVAVDVHDHMYFILRGQVRLTAIDGSEINVLGPGDCFGEMAVIHSDHGKQGLLRRDSAQALTDCALYTLSKTDVEKIFPRHPRMREKLYKLSAVKESDMRAETRSCAPKYPDCRLSGAVYISGLGSSQVKVEPKKDFGIKLLAHEHVRACVTDEVWPGLVLETTSVNVNEPSGTGRKQGVSGASEPLQPLQRTMRLRPVYEKGLEVNKVYEDAETLPERLDAIATTYSAKFFRLKNLRKEGMSYVENIGKMR